MVGAHVVNVHAQNRRPSCLEEGKMELSWISEGLVDYSRVLSLLKSHGFDGYVEAEFLKGDTTPSGILATVSQDINPSDDFSP